MVICACASVKVDAYILIIKSELDSEEKEETKLLREANRIE